MAKQHNKITADERDKIALWLAQGERNRGIALRPGRSHSSIGGELKRSGLVNGEYGAIQAQPKI